MKSAFLALVATIGLAAPAAAASTDQMQTVSKRIATAHLDLSQPEVRARLDRRIRSAAREVCRDNSGPIAMALDRQCYDRALERALKQRDRLIAARLGQTYASLAN